MAIQLRCPTCRQPMARDDNPFRPFCSERCQVVDLGNWASDRYRVPGEPITEDDDVDPSPEGGAGTGGH